MGKLDYKKMFLLGFGFFTIGVTLGVYNAFMPKLLSNYITSSAVIGFIMTLDNYLALFIQPAVGMYSDTLNTRFGRRMPFLIIGMPMVAFFNLLIPNHKGLVSLIVFLVLMNLFVSIYRSPVIALMPDITPPEQQSKANSIISFMGGIGALMAFFIGGMLWDKSPKYPFYLVGVLVIIAFIVLFTSIKEKRDVIDYKAAEEKINVRDGIAVAFKNPITKYLLFAIAAWFIGYNGIETFFTRYAEVYLGIGVSAAALTFSFVSLSFLLSAIPAGIIGTKIGKKKSITIGLIGVTIILFALIFIKDILIIRIVFLILGFFWALININAFPFVAQLSPLGYIGTFTGLYYLFSSIASIISPPILGLLFDSIGYSCMFAYSMVFMVVALLFMLKVKEE
ncbi:MAG: MFS transporter [Clostridium sp.]